MAKNKKEKQLGEADFREAQKALFQEVGEVAGRNGHDRPRFPRFRVVDDVKSIIESGLQEYEMGLVHQATRTLQKALQSLQWRQRLYFRRAAETHFGAEVAKLRESGLDQDLIARVTKAIDLVNRHAHQDDQFDLAAAGRLYWKTEEAIASVCCEQEARERNRAEKENRLAEARAREEQEARLARQREAQRAHDEAEAQRRRQEADAAREELAALLV